jgi:hypothetical protein
MQIVFLPFISAPPGIPEFLPSGILLTGDAHKLTCTTKAGNPPAKLNWFRGASMMESHYSVIDDIVKAEVSNFLRPSSSKVEQLSCFSSFLLHFDSYGVHIPND